MTGMVRRSLCRTSQMCIMLSSYLYLINYLPNTSYDKICDRYTTCGHHYTEIFQQVCNKNQRSFIFFFKLNYLPKITLSYLNYRTIIDSVFVASHKNDLNK